MYAIILKKIEKIFVFLTIYIVPVIVVAMLALMFFRVLPVGEMQENLAWFGFWLLVVLLGIKPLSSICKRDLQATYRKLPDGITYLVK